jgi:hypothetical protein
MLIPDPGSWLLSSPDPTTATKENGEKSLKSYIFFVATNITKLTIILFFNWQRKKFGAIYKEFNTFTPNIVIKFSKGGVNKKHIPDPDPQHCLQIYLYFK